MGNITTDRIKGHIDCRINEGLANATINRELSALKRMFSLASECTPRKVREIPHIPMLKESNVRKGFFEYDQFVAVKEALPDYLKSLATLAYHIGWRKGEVLNLTWDKVDMKQRTIRLDPGETKNEEARNVYMNDDLFKEMQGVFSQRRLGCPYVFHHAGQPITLKRMRPFATLDNVNGMVARAAIAALEDQQAIEECVRRNANDRQEFFNQAVARMLKPIDSHTNFVMMNAHHSAAEVTGHFRRNKILIGQRFPAMDTYIRVSLGTPSEMRAFWRAWDLLPYANMHHH